MGDDGVCRHTNRSLCLRHCLDAARPLRTPQLRG